MPGQTPTPPAVVDRMLTLASVGQGDILYDLGCGDGRIVIAAAQRGATALGVDSDAAQIARAESAAREAGVADKASFRCEDMAKVDISKATVVALYLGYDANFLLRPALQQLPPGARVVSHNFDMGDWAPTRTECIEGRYLYLWLIGENTGETRAISRPLNLHYLGLPEHRIGLEVEFSPDAATTVLSNYGDRTVLSVRLEWEFACPRRRSKHGAVFQLRRAGDPAPDTFIRGGRRRLSSSTISNFIAGRCREDLWLDFTARVMAVELE